jgi:predicted nucleic acid-binding protein
MKRKVYIETSVVSYLTAWRSRDLILAANQEETRDWWDERSNGFDLFVSEIVIQEASAGDVNAATRRLEVLKTVTELDVTVEAQDLAKELMAKVPLPDKAQIDALHIAVATVHGMDYLLTWNCSHIANAALRHPIEAVCRDNQYEPPVICTPLELTE